jgi:hypothetical protein
MKDTELREKIVNIIANNCSRPGFDEYTRSADQILSIIKPNVLSEECTCKEPHDTFVVHRSPPNPCYIREPKPELPEELNWSGKAIPVNNIKEGTWWITETHDKINEIIKYLRGKEEK